MSLSPYPLAALCLLWAAWLLVTSSPPPTLHLHLQAATAPASLPVEALTPQQRLMAGRRLDLNRATEPELVALPEIGEGLARSILTRRLSGPLECWAAFEEIPGIGSRRARHLASFVLPLPHTCPGRHQTR